MISRRWWLPMAALAVAAVAAGVGWTWREPLTTWLDAATSGAIASPRPPQPDPTTYAVLKSELARWHGELAQRHQMAKTRAQRAAVEHDARVVLERTLPAMMRCWLGTPWDFNGTASQPGGGRIACGYFVATVMKDAGFHLDRYRLAQQASGNIMRSFLDKDACALTVGQSYPDFLAHIARAEPGIYLIGLDTHVAFLVVTVEGFRFIHSSGSHPYCVVDEGPREAHVLQRSNWRMMGNLTANPKVLRCWLSARPIAVHGT